MGMLAAFGPIWILTAAGYGARRARIIDDHLANGLGRFVFHLAMPAALFLTMSRTPLSSFAGGSLVAFATSTVVVIGAGWLVAARWFGRKPGERAIWGMSAGYVNSANLGIPIAMQVLGNVSFLFEVVLLQTLVVTPVILTALDRADDASGRLRLRRLLTLPVRNPVILGSVFGVLASALGYHPTGVIDTSLRLMSAAAVPAALVALGASLHRDDASVERTRAELGIITAGKLVAQPLIAYVVGAFVLHLSHPQLLAVVVCAGLPTAQNTFIYAQEYRAGATLAGRAVLATTVLSLVTLAAIAASLG
ncbi:MAG: AEC family transporter [Actinocatenispora sp.]